MTFSITVSSLELVNSGAMFPADSSVFEITASLCHRVSLVLGTGVRDSNPSPHTLSLFLLKTFSDWTRTKPDKGSPVTV
jgi:hypothetical protein